MNKQTLYADNLGLQLWTLRNEIEKDPETTLMKVADLGYKQLEGMSLPQVMALKEIASNTGLSFYSSFFQWTYLTQNWELANQKGVRKINNINSFEHLVELAYQQGLTHLTFGYIFEEERGVENYRKWAEILNKAGEQCKAAGITLSYHHHGFEFKEEKNTTIFDLLLERLDFDLVKFELDTFWLEIAGMNPLKMLQKLEGKVSALHLKALKSNSQIYYNDQIVPHDFFVPLGKGVIDFSAILGEAKRQQIKTCFVEQDYAKNPFQSIEESINWLKRYEKQ
ncbi:sugar phosphate isomerase/epimerase family protein [Flammeovirga aprica]|uniref:Sugar phosphate isomerase/epimerase n=1 Tax=Flammeovirga aprica JL-4 TaxID=694437 RepID=A0A7X9XBI4_9BACT|nr:sugar phosphate isomerase/epimerase [Flammeovirga aprica]NME70781.1 sugar phosphate isomerase/epimerase [Flammeovirga aprica JL-4]